jgi:hypothetical protein
MCSCPPVPFPFLVTVLPLYRRQVWLITGNSLGRSICRTVRNHGISSDCTNSVTLNFYQAGQLIRIFY